MKWQELFYNDVEAYARNPDFNWVYDKLSLVKDQGIACAPVGVNPNNYPVCIRPIINLFGMSRDAHYIENIDDYEEYITDERPSGQFWMPFSMSRFIFFAFASPSSSRSSTLALIH